MFIIGIDFSISGCALTLCSSEKEFKFDNCSCFYLTSTKKHVGQRGNVFGQFHQDYECEEERFDQITNSIMSWIPKEECVIGLEGFSMGSRSGMAFTIGSCQGLLKHKLWKAGYEFDSIPPTTIKKFAGKGNYSKVQMAEAFTKETGIELHKVLNCTLGKSPAADIIDSYFICKYVYQKEY